MSCDLDQLQQARKILFPKKGGVESHWVVREGEVGQKMSTKKKKSTVHQTFSTDSHTSQIKHCVSCTHRTCSRFDTC